MPLKIVIDSVSPTEVQVWFSSLIHKGADKIFAKSTWRSDDPVFVAQQGAWPLACAVVLYLLGEDVGVSTVKLSPYRLDFSISKAVDQSEVFQGLIELVRRIDGSLVVERAVSY